MHKTARHVRFSINPFLPSDNDGFNSFASKPAGEGLSLFFELLVEVAGDIVPATGFVVNVTDIDENVRQFVVPFFAGRIREDFRQGRHIGFFQIAELLKTAWSQLADKFGSAKLSKLSLKLNPFRKVEIDSEDSKMFYFSERFEFAATHKLWNEQFSNERNFEVFGNCANPAGHGHNYVIDVTIKKPIGGDNSSGRPSYAKGFAGGERPCRSPDFCIGDFEKIVDDELIKLIDHKNLNADVGQFKKTNPTIENIAVFAWNKLADKFSDVQLHCVTVWETDKTYCSYYGQ